MAEHAAPWAAGDHAAVRREREPVELTVSVAIQGSFCPPADRQGDEVVAADQSLVVDIEGLVRAVGMESARESDVQPAPDLSAFPPRFAVADLGSVDSQHP